MTDWPIRASDQERESVVDVLRDAFTDGRLTFDEFEERTASAYAAKTWTQLRELTSDLPAQPVLGAYLHHRPQAGEPGAIPPAVQPRRRFPVRTGVPAAASAAMASAARRMSGATARSGALASVTV